MAVVGKRMRLQWIAGALLLGLACQAAPGGETPRGQDTGITARMAPQRGGVFQYAVGGGILDGGADPQGGGGGGKFSLFPIYENLILPECLGDLNVEPLNTKLIP